MEITDFSQGQIWGIHPDKLEVLMKKFNKFASSENFAIEAAKFGPPGQEQPKPYEIRSGVAVIPISGPLSKRDSFFSFLYGGSSVVSVSRALQAALADPQVKAIVLSIDSPGGVVGVVESLTQAVKSAGEQKPVVSFANGMMASAAYWIGSSASTIIAESTAEVGSIGVVMVHYDLSEMDRQLGIKRTFVSAGKYKAMGNSAEPLSGEARAMFEAQLNHYYNLFVSTVAENRGTDVQAVLEKMADGRIFIGKQAVEAGLVDQIGNLQTAIDKALEMVSGSLPQRSSNQRKEKQMEIKTVEQLTAAHPALVEDVKKAAIASVDVSGAKTEAVKGEQSRVISLITIQFGEEAGNKMKAIIESGVSVEQFQAIRALNPPEAAADPDKAAREKMLKALQKSGSENPGSGAGGGTAGEKDFLTLVSEYRMTHKCSKTEAMQAVMEINPAAHKKYLAEANKK